MGETIASLSYPPSPLPPVPTALACCSEAKCWRVCSFVRFNLWTFSLLRPSLSLSLALCKPLYYVHEVAMKYVVYWVSLSNIWELVCSHNRQWSEGWLLSSSSHANSTSKRHAAIQFKCHEKEQNWPKYAFPFKPYIIKLIWFSLKSAVGKQESIYLYSVVMLC